MALRLDFTKEGRRELISKCLPFHFCSDSCFFFCFPLLLLGPVIHCHRSSASGLVQAAKLASLLLTISPSGAGTSLSSFAASGFALPQFERGEGGGEKRRTKIVSSLSLFLFENQDHRQQFTSTDNNNT